MNSLTSPFFICRYWRDLPKQIKTFHTTSELHRWFIFSLNLMKIFVKFHYSRPVNFVCHLITKWNKHSLNPTFFSFQIGIMLDSNGSAPLGGNSIDKFSHHPYEVSPRTPNYSAIFGVEARAIQTEMVRSIKSIVKTIRITRKCKECFDFICL